MFYRLSTRLLCARATIPCARQRRRGHELSAQFQLPARLAWLSCVAAVIVASASTVSSSTSSKALTAAGTLSLWPGFIDLQGAAAEFATIERSNCLLGFARVCHLNKCKPARPSGLPVSHYADFIHLTMGLKETS
jgi:hypothetical protein